VSKDKTVVEFDDQPDEGRLAAYQQLVERSKERGSAVPLGAAPPIEGAPNMVDAQEQARTARMPGLEHTYTEEEYKKALSRGAAVQGVGSAFPANQQASLGERAAVPGDEMLRPETQEGLAALAAANKAEAVPEAPAEEAKPAGSPADVDPDFVKMLLGQQVDPMQRKERRERIEKRLKALDIRQLLVGSGVVQRVPIIDDVFVVKYRSLNGYEDSFAKRYAWQLAKGDSSQMYYDTTMSLVNLTLSLFEINGEEIVDHRTAGKGAVDEAVFEAKFESLMQKPFVVLHDLWTNYMWFDQRVRDLLDVESLGNG